MCRISSLFSGPGNEDGVRKDDKIQGLVRAMIEIRLY